MFPERNIEVELKFQILNGNQIKNFLKNLIFLKKKQEVDVYLDTPNGDLYKKSIFIRIRNNKTLDFKYSLAVIENRKKINKDENFEDYSFSLPLTKSSLLKINQICKVLGLQRMKTLNLERFKANNHLINSITIDKIREKYKDKKFEYCVDGVKELGRFLEIETLVSTEEESKKLMKEMRNKVKRLKLKEITTGYCGLYWRKHNFNLYRQARYILEEDRF